MSYSQHEKNGERVLHTSPFLASWVSFILQGPFGSFCVLLERFPSARIERQRSRGTTKREESERPYGFGTAPNTQQPPNAPLPCSSGHWGLVSGMRSNQIVQFLTGTPAPFRDRFLCPEAPVGSSYESKIGRHGLQQALLPSL